MLFLIALAVAVLFTAALSKALRKAPLPFYIAAALLSAGAVIVSRLDVESEFLMKWVFPLFTKGAMAAGFWALVMWAGALPRESRITKRLLSVRGELSIFAAVLTLSHAVLRAILYLRQLLRPKYSPDAVFAATCAIVLALLVIMLPLTVLSFRRVRKRMAPDRWKRIQRLAYGFYGLIYAHVLVLYLPPALRGLRSYALTVAVYTVVWLAYMTCRLLNRKNARRGTD
jgi:DMSO/TMAO reductase YedYZ heme-binding membrane subunit